MQHAEVVLRLMPVIFLLIVSSHILLYATAQGRADQWADVAAMREEYM